MVLLRPPTPLTRTRYVGTRDVKDRQLVAPADSARVAAPSPSQRFSLQPCHRRRALPQSSKVPSHDWHSTPTCSTRKRRPLGVRLSYSFSRNSKPPGIQTRQMSTTRYSVATTSGDVILNFAPHPSQKRRPSRCIALCFARPSRDARNSPSSVSYADRDPDTSEPISSWSVNHFRATRLGHVQLQCSRATCGYAYPSEKLMQVLHIQLLQRADEMGWGLEHLAGNRDGCLSG